MELLDSKIEEIAQTKRKKTREFIRFKSMNRMSRRWFDFHAQIIVAADHGSNSPTRPYTVELIRHSSAASATLSPTNWSDTLKHFQSEN